MYYSACGLSQTAIISLPFFNLFYVVRELEIQPNFSLERCQEMPRKWAAFYTESYFLPTLAGHQRVTKVTMI